MEHVQMGVFNDSDVADVMQTTAQLAIASLRKGLGILSE